MRTLITFVFLFTTAAWSQVPLPSTTPAVPSTPPEPVDPLGRTTPNGTVLGFLKASTSDDYPRAAQYLNTKSKDAPELARKLHRVMDAGLHGGLNRVSREPEGSMADALAPNREKIGTIDLADVKFDVELDRVKQKDGPDIWLFSPRTLREVPDAFESTQPPALFNSLPTFIRDTLVFDIPLWRWFLGIGAFVVAFISASLIARVLILIVKLITRLRGSERTWNPDTLTSPLRVVFLAIALRFLSANAATLLARSAGENLAIALAIIGITWMIGRLSDVISDLRSQLLVRQQRVGTITVVALTRRLFKLTIWFVAGILLLQHIGVNVTALFAGLGLGGIAIALAARKTIENMFGGISIITREAMRVGDTCEINGQMGIVEDIGLGTTRLRTLDRTVVSLPNAQLAQLDVENFSMRDKFWLHQIIELRPATTEHQMAELVTAVNVTLKKHPKVEPASARARFIGFSPTSLKLEVSAYVLDANNDSFLISQEQILFHVLGAIEAAGSGLAVPLLVTPPKPEPEHVNDLEKLAESSI